MNNLSPIKITDKCNEKTNTGIKNLSIVTFTTSILLAALLLTSCGNNGRVTEIDALNYVNVRFNGDSGSASISVWFTERFNNELAIAAGINQMDFFRLYQLYSSFTLSASPNRYLHNGDVVTIMIDFDERVGQQFNVRPSRTTKTVTVEGLREILVFTCPSQIDERLLSEMSEIAQDGVLSHMLRSMWGGPHFFGNLYHIESGGRRNQSFSNGFTRAAIEDIEFEINLQSMYLLNVEVANTIFEMTWESSRASLIAIFDISANVPDYEVHSQLMAIIPRTVLENGELTVSSNWYNVGMVNHGVVTDYNNSISDFLNYVDENHTLQVVYRKQQ